MHRFVCALLLPLAAGCLLASCLLPDVGIDPSLDDVGTGGTDMMVSPLRSGASGSGGSGAGGAGTAGAGGAAPSGADGDADLEEACIDYCRLYTEVCEGHPAYDYDDFIDCTRTCGTSGWELGTVTGTEPGSIRCRLVHAGLAQDLGLDPHCYHAAREPSRGSCEVTR